MDEETVLHKEETQTGAIFGGARGNPVHQRKILGVSVRPGDRFLLRKEETQKKKRPCKPVTVDLMLRKICKDPTRQRFFGECRKKDSILWQESPNGKEVMHKRLFDSAAREPMDAVYRGYPGLTQGVHSTVVKKAIQWQVYKDRSNWLHKTPKRVFLFGDPMPFDWAAELVKQEEIKPRKSSEKEVRSRIKKEPKQSAATAAASVPQTYDLDYMKCCDKCAVQVWIGQENEVPRGVQLACPRETDWTDNAEPYCGVCWEKESALLDGMTKNYKAIGTKNAATKLKDAAKKKADAIKKAEARKTVAAKKKADAIKKADANKKTLAAKKDHAKKKSKKQLRRYRVGQSVNGKFTDKRYYGAFISKVNINGTYNLYFFEEDDTPLMNNVPPADIKDQLKCTASKRFASWEDYVGKSFFDPGTQNAEGDCNFEAGEFVVTSVAKNNNFVCSRVGVHDSDEEFDIGYVMKRIRIHEEET